MVKNKRIKNKRATASKRGQKAQERYVLKLFVAGISSKSLIAIDNIKKLCDEHLKGKVELEIIDIYQTPILAKNDQIVAAPTLIKELPLPIKRFIGDMSDTKKMIVGLNLLQK